MKIHVRYFASVREQIGLAQETVETQTTNLHQLRAELIQKGGAYASGLSLEKPLRMALNQTVVDGQTLLEEGAEVAFFPPVTGG